MRRITHNFHDFGQSKKKLLFGPNINVISGIAAFLEGSVEEENGQDQEEVERRASQPPATVLCGRPVRDQQPAAFRDETEKYEPDPFLALGGCMGSKHC